MCSYIPDIFKLNSCVTLIHRAYFICSDCLHINFEFQFLDSFFKHNCYPACIFQKSAYQFLNNIFKPKILIPSVPKLVKYISFPYLGFHSKCFEKQLTSILSKHVPFLELKLIFNNPYKIGSFFKFKDSLPLLMRSKVVYIFTCPKCTLGNYVGCTLRLLKIRINNHQGVSHRTLNRLSNPENSPIKNHCNSCKRTITYSDFKILKSVKFKLDLYISESLFIKNHTPSLNRDQSSIPLYIA